MTRQMLVAGSGLVKLPSSTSEREWVCLGGNEDEGSVDGFQERGGVSQLNQAMPMLISSLGTAASFKDRGQGLSSTEKLTPD